MPYVSAPSMPYRYHDAALSASDNETTIQKRELAYHFYPHFHPYVAELVKRLNEGSVRGLQAVDTEYLKNKDDTLEILPGSILAALPGSVKVTLPGGTQENLLAGTHITLPDNTVVTSPGGNQATLPGKMLTTMPKGIRVTVGSGTEAISFGEIVTLVAGTLVARPDGTLVTLPAGTSVTLLACKPKPKLHEDIFSESSYDPSPQAVAKPYPVKDLDFTSSGAYSAYNWELFYHVPITIAIHLSKNQRFEEAMKWFHYVFDPTDDSDGPTPERFWKVKPFQYTDVKMVEEILTNLSTGADPVLQKDTINNIDKWKDTPFRPHVVARYRQSAYMFKTVMAYLDNLVAWGDTLFRQDTGESINEATQLYVLAANILGPRPQAVPKKGSVSPQNYDNLRTHLDEFGNALVDLETELPFDLAPPPNGASSTDRFGAVPSLGATLYFCIPRNDKLLGYWDTVADRLFKIRNSLNIQGIFRQLPLFEAPIDPALLAKAAAAGLDMGAIVSGANQPLPLVRFQFLVQKAAEICQEVKSLGNNLLSAIEKEDNEALAVLRARHERVILGMAETVKYAQWQETIKAREGLEKSRDNAIQRYTYYRRLLGDKDEDITKAIPELDALDTDGLEKMKFRASEPEMEQPAIEVDIAQDAEGIAGGKKISSHELQEFNLLEDARGLQDSAAIMDLIGSYLSLIPQFEASAEPVGVGAGATFGGEQLSKMLSMMANMTRTGADQLTYAANKTSKIGSYARREQEWAYQSNLAAAEITQTFKQLRAAQIREAIAEREWKNHKQQIENAEDIELFLKGEDTPVGDGRHRKTSTKDFYTWMKREVKGLYGQCFQFASDIARKAERALQHELGDPGQSFLEFGYLSGKEGLLAGEKLFLDIKRMEMAYHDLNRREYELTKQVSLLEVDPRALLQLRETGHCTVSLPEELFDMGCPGHFFRRIKSVAVSIPCVTGPYTSVNCTLTLLKSSIRKTQVLRGDIYEREGVEDDRFSDYFGSLQSIVTSSGQNDSGLFETNLRDERYLPFEGSGAVSEWQLELPPANLRQFDYDTISDVVLHLRYTAREGGVLLRNGAVRNLNTRIDEAQAVGSVRLFSVRREFPSEWAKFTSVKIKDNIKTSPLILELRQEHFPFWSQEGLKAVKRVDWFAKNGKSPIEITENADGTGKKDALVQDESFGNLWIGHLTDLPQLDQAAPLSIKFNLNFTDNTMDDLWLALAWGK
jgi:hypothetical protein